MQQLARLMDDFDDMLGVCSAASSPAFILIAFLSIVLLLVATAVLGITGFGGGLLAVGAATGAATRAKKDA